mmetsp:Transcript_116239/g.323098  ORF Transcript_116239/g.323098 Transcript_116239/m.323098 type:complete len:219 (+) Transcript_116239:174-830(+)
MTAPRAGPRASGSATSTSSRSSCRRRAPPRPTAAAPRPRRQARANSTRTGAASVDGGAGPPPASHRRAHAPARRRPCPYVWARGPSRRRVAWGEVGLAVVAARRGLGTGHGVEGLATGASCRYAQVLQVAHESGPRLDDAVLAGREEVAGAARVRREAHGRRAPLVQLRHLPNGVPAPAVRAHVPYPVASVGARADQHASGRVPRDAHNAAGVRALEL